MTAVEEVKARLDIVEVVGAYVRLQKAGRYFKANCPFHNEKTPSFYVYPDRQNWHCFGACSTGGDVISFVSKKENLDFTGALRLMAERAGVELQSDGPRRQEIKGLQDANEAAALFYHGLLGNSSSAQAYIQERGLDQKTVSDFQLGYAPPGWNTLRDHLTSRGYSESQLVEAGLLVEGERGPYDRFRDRLIFPIRDDRGRVVGLGGRVLPGGDAESQPSAKYVNTPQTSVFDKGSLLYGLDRAKGAIRGAGTAVIVEGYMDVIAAHQFGHRNVVASMGTALTERQAALLQRFAERVVLAMDADEAGSAANLRAIQVVGAAERPTRVAGRPRSLDIRVVALPKGKDPDELIRSSENDAWPNAVDSARPVVDHLLAVVSAGLDLLQPRDRSQLVAEVLPAIADVNDPVLRAHYLQRLSRLARVSEEELRRELRRRPRQRSNGPEGPTNGVGDEAATPSIRLKAASGAREAYLLTLLHRVSALAEQGKELDEELFYISENRELFRRWRLSEPVTEDESELWELYQVVMAANLPIIETNEAETAFLDCVHRLQHAKIRAVKEASALALAEGMAGVRPGQVASIARARMETGSAEETQEDDATANAVSQLLQDMEAGLRFHRRSNEGSRSDQQG